MHKYIILFIILNASPVWANDQIDANTKAIMDLEVRTDWQNEDRLKTMQRMSEDFSAMRNDGAEVVRILKEEQVAAAKERRANSENNVRVTTILEAVQETLRQLKDDGRAKDIRDDEQDKTLAIIDERSVNTRWLLGMLISVLTATGLVTKFFNKPKKNEEKN